MNSNLSKVCAIAVVLAFACSAFAVVYADTSDASDSAKTYHLYFEEVGSDYTVAKATWITFQASDSTFGSFKNAANQAFSVYGIDASFNDSGWITSATYGSSFSTYVAKDGKWTAVSSTSSDYNAATEIAIEAGAGSYTYGSAPPADVISSYIKVSDTYYTRAPYAAVGSYDDGKTYYVHYEVIDAAYKMTSSTWFSFKAVDDTFVAFRAGINAAFALYGIDDSTSAKGWFANSMSTYTSVDGKWKAVETMLTDYPAATYIALEAGAGSYTYGSAPPADVISSYIKVNDTYYTRAPSASADDYKTVTHNLVYEEIGNDCKVTKTTSFKFVSDDATLTAFVASANKAFLENGLDAKFNSKGWVSSTTYGSNNATWVSNGSEWTAVSSTGTDYNSAEGIAIEAGEKSYFYKAEPPADMKDKYSGPDKYGMYHRMPDTAADWYKDKDHSLRNGLVIGGVVAVVLVAALAYFFIGKKKQ